MNENGGINMSPHLEWNILLGELAAELVGFHVRSLQTKWDLDSFVSVLLAHSDTHKWKTLCNTTHIMSAKIHGIKLIINII